jgi:hypothetical protein
MARAGVQPNIAERVLGHAMGRVEGAYDRPSYEDEKRQALEALSSGHPGSAGSGGIRSFAETYTDASAAPPPDIARTAIEPSDSTVSRSLRLRLSAYPTSGRCIIGYAGRI